MTAYLSVRAIQVKPISISKTSRPLSKMDFTEHYVDREVIKQFVHTIVPVTETCFNWYMNFDLIDVPNDMKKLVWEFTIDYKSARSYRKEKNGMLRPNQWQDLTVKVFI